MRDLDKCREEIDDIDAQLVSLFEKRLNVVKEVEEYKIENDMDVFQPEREQNVIEKNLDKVQNQQLKPYVKSFLQDNMAVAKSYESDLLPYRNEENYASDFKKDAIVGYQGVKGAFSQQAVASFFGQGTKDVGYPEFEDVYKALADGDIDYGVLPIENSLTGSINDNYDLIRQYNFNIVGEVAVPVSQCLMALPGVKLEEITQAYSHPQGLAQCSIFFNEHKNIEAMPYKDTAMAAHYVQERQERNKAAVASPLAAELYGLEILIPNIQDDISNMTRFMVIAKEMICPEDATKMSVIFTLNHQVGSLYHMLQIIKQNEINLVRIESRPMKEANWQYYFYIDFEGNIRDRRIETAIEQMRNHCNTLRVLGSYCKK